jgi:hypothetical protein
MRPIADLSHSAYDTLEFVKQHYPEMVQMYETIMAHLKVPEAAPVVEPSEPSEPAEVADTHVAYTITDVFDTVIIDPDIIHNILGYTDEEIPVMCKRAGLKYLGLYNVEARTFNDGHYEETESGEEWVEDNYEYPARQVPMFAIIKGYEVSSIRDDGSFSTEITQIPVNHKRSTVIFTAEHARCSDENFQNSDAVPGGFDTNVTLRKGILWDCSYAHQCKTYNGERIYKRYEGFEEVTTHEGTTYGTIAEYKCTDAKLYQVTTTVTTLIDVNDTIYLPEVL